MSPAAVRSVALVLERLEELAPSVVLVGGSALPFLLPGALFALTDVRYTDDVDLIVEIATAHDFQRRYARRLR